MKQKRINILKSITLLESERCTVCFGSKQNKEATNRKCLAAVEIRKLGKQMSKLVDKRKSADGREEPKRYDPKMRKLAETNGISYDYFWQRVSKYGWTELRAATEPVRRNGRKNG